jgi:hypothetical protein
MQDIIVGQVLPHLCQLSIIENAIDSTVYIYAVIFTRFAGSGESGKSTIVKQMKIIHQNGYSNEELYPWRITVYKNLIESAQALVYGVTKFALEFENPKNVVCAPPYCENSYCSRYTSVILKQRYYAGARAQDSRIYSSY